MLYPDWPRSRSPLPVGRVDLSAVASGYTFPGFAVADQLTKRFGQNQWLNRHSSLQEKSGPARIASASGRPAQASSRKFANVRAAHRSATIAPCSRTYCSLNHRAKTDNQFQIAVSPRGTPPGSKPNATLSSARGPAPTRGGPVPPSADS